MQGSKHVLVSEASLTWDSTGAESLVTSWIKK